MNGTPGRPARGAEIEGYRVIRITEGPGVLKIDMRRELGELGSAKSGAGTPDRPKATPIRQPEPERSPGVTMPWARPLCASSNAVQYATERMSA